jgi:superfamily II DNA or RNA helicase
LPAFTHLELHRAGIGLVPRRGGPDTAIYIATVPGSRQPLRSCTCAAARLRTCEHLHALAGALSELERQRPRLGWEERFAATVWYRLARLLHEGNPQSCAGIDARRLPAGGGLQIASPGGVELACYLDRSPAELRLVERTGKLPRADTEGAAGGEGREGAEGETAGTFDRAALLDRLTLFQLTPAERELAKRGSKTQRQTWEESFWHRLAYHCVRETLPLVGAEEGAAAERDADGGTGAGKVSGGTFHPAVETGSGRFTLTFRDGERPIVRVTVARGQVEAALRLLAESFPGQADLAISPLPLRSILHVGAETSFDRPEVEVRPAIQAIQRNGETRYFAAEDKFRYGNLVFLPELGILAALEREGKERKFRAPAHLKLNRSQVPAFLDAHGTALADGYLVLAEPLRGKQVWKRFDAIAVSGLALERSWTWLDASYGFGSDRVALAELLAARRDGLPYLETRFGWIDLGAPAFDHLGRLLERAAPAGGDGLRLPLVEALRLWAAAGVPVRPEGAGAAEIGRLLDLRTATPVGQPAGLRSALRPYQQIGADWLRFLCENRLAGLLCDDMGLGKTHQVMALMLSLAERGEAAAPFLVICPTTVASHWQNKLREHAPGLPVRVHHGSQRSLPQSLAPGEVVVTTYGVLRRDEAELARHRFALAVFDEAQHLKNPGTRAYQAAARLDAEVRIGLTGTPIENSLADLKALFDLVLPGYLGALGSIGADREFEERYLRGSRQVRPAGNGMTELDGAAVTTAASGQIEIAAAVRGDSPEILELRRLIAPFVLRRTKTAVLAELPEKIDDLRTCMLSDDQVKLYREAIGSRGTALARELEAASGPPPYIHIFALLNLLKQICDHPALVAGGIDQADRFSSGKWDLYREVLEECLGSGLKVVVFSQYLGMLRLMERHLAALDVGHVKLTGGSGGTARRGAIVDRFNGDPACRVFLGSLKAGGTGIDLVAGSVVIHYDRWWNAAREDQATDRVHRIGQRRAVQVIKLITAGTLEEKIAAIIERKRHTLDAVVPVDDPELAKLFTREELLDLLRWPGPPQAAAGGQGDPSDQGEAAGGAVAGGTAERPVG